MNNDTPKPIDETPTPDLTPEANNNDVSIPEDGDKRKGKTFAISGVLLLVIIISVIVTTMMMNGGKKDGGEGGDNGGGSSIVDDGDDEESTELSSGTVTTKIDGKTISYAGAYVVDGIEATISSGTYESATDNQAVFLVINGGKLTIKGGTVINKTGSENFQGRGDDYSFYGINSAIVVVGEGSTATIDGALINTSVSGANAVVATNSGSVTIKNSTISTTKDGSRGLHATYSGVIKASNTKISTKGGSSASLATDRGEGTVEAVSMELSTAGAGSPLIYSTGDIKVSSSTGTSTGAQIAVVEGKNSVTIDDCEFSTNGIGNRNNVDNAAVMIYQSMSGDASVGTGSFTATDSKFTVLSDSEQYQTVPFFFVTNTTATITLDGVNMEFYEDGYFILASGTNEWGKSGNNGATVTVNANNIESSSTEVGVDEISSVTGL